MNKILCKTLSFTLLLMLTSTGKSSATTVAEAKAIITKLESRLTNLINLVNTQEEAITKLVNKKTPIFKNASETGDNNEIHVKCKGALKGVASSLDAQEYENNQYIGF